MKIAEKMSKTLTFETYFWAFYFVLKNSIHKKDVSSLFIFVGVFFLVIELASWLEVAVLHYHIFSLLDYALLCFMFAFFDLSFQHESSNRLPFLSVLIDV